LPRVETTGYDLRRLPLQEPPLQQPTLSKLRDDGIGVLNGDVEFSEEYT
jgi:hypothetical protein